MVEVIKKNRVIVRFDCLSSDEGFLNDTRKKEREERTEAKGQESPVDFPVGNWTSGTTSSGVMHK
jgi:hypothetical protein